LTAMGLFYMFYASKISTGSHLRPVVREDSPKYTSPELIYNNFKQLSNLDREHFMVVHLDGQNRILAKETISIGSLNETTVHPREVFKGAVLNGSAAVILLHNHPSGNPSPSLSDIATTDRLRKAGNIVGIQVLDHIIIGTFGFYSFCAAEQKKNTRRKAA